MKKKTVRTHLFLRRIYSERFLAIALLFSGEESYGRYLDLYSNHTAFSNIKNLGKRPTYLQYLDLLIAAQSQPVHSDLSKEARFTKDYEKSVVPFHTRHTRCSRFIL